MQAVGRWWLLWEFGDDTMADREACIKAYLQHNAHIEASVPPEQLLVWQAKDGWEPLCRWIPHRLRASMPPRGSGRRLMGVLSG